MAVLDKIKSKVNWKNAIFFLLAFTALAFVKGLTYAFNALLLLLVLSLNAIVVIDILGYIRSKIPVGNHFKYFFCAAIIVDTYSVVKGNGAVVIFFGIFIPLVFALALLFDDWLKVFWTSIKTRVGKK